MSESSELSEINASIKNIEKILTDYCTAKGKPKRATDDYPKIQETMFRSLEWKRWYRHNYENGPFWDVDETQECGWMSKGHWDDFVYFIKNGLGGVSKDKDTDTE